MADWPEDVVAGVADQDVDEAVDAELLVVGLDAEVVRSDGSPLEIILNVVIEAADGRVLVHLRSDRAGTPLSIGPGSWLA